MGNMNWREMSRRVFRFIALLVAAALAYGAVRGTGFYQFTAREAEGLNTLILLIGNIYAVMFAFVIFVIWGHFTDVENFIMRECRSLRDLLRFSEYLSPDAAQTIRRTLTDYLPVSLAERRVARLRSAPALMVKSKSLRAFPAKDVRAGYPCLHAVVP